MSKDLAEKVPTSDSLKIGDWVRVRGAEQIEKTLVDGRLDGLPFMPEMVAYCDCSFRIKRFATKVCVNGESIEICSLENCVILQMQNRCDGSHHGNCDMGCDFIWKLDWLIQLEQPPVAESEPSAPPAPPEFLSRLVQISTCGDMANGNLNRDKQSARFCCQATELTHATSRLSPLQFKQYVTDSKLNNVSKFTIGKFIASVLIKKITKQSDSLAGPCRGRTPASKPLNVGDWVQIKSLEEIRLTLDEGGCNRGLWFDPKEMAAFCGQELIISRKIERLIDERTGELKVLKTPSYVLSETECSGIFRRFCSRGMLHFWREIWLTKTGSES